MKGTLSQRVTGRLKSGGGPHHHPPLGLGLDHVLRLFTRIPGESRLLPPPNDAGKPARVLTGSRLVGRNELTGIQVYRPLVTTMTNVEGKPSPQARAHMSASRAEMGTTKVAVEIVVVPGAGARLLPLFKSSNKTSGRIVFPNRQVALDPRLAHLPPLLKPHSKPTVPANM